MKTKLAMVIDSSACIDCKGCMAACKVENKVPADHWRNWIKHQEVDFSMMKKAGRKTGGHFQPGNCMHCDIPTCVQACPTNATFKDKKDGTVKVNEKLCIGCGSCIPACPYGARYRHPEKKIVDKCDFCEHRRMRGDLPACVTTCPTKARVFGDIKDSKSDAARLLKQNKTKQVVNPDSNTDPNIYYINTTAPIDWPLKAEIPTPIELWAKVAKPLVWTAVGLNALGVLVMLGKQFIMPDDENQADHQKGEQE
jgi:tetrathionate reductase subunit B